jgi:hypothetical protein
MDIGYFIAKRQKLEMWSLAPLVLILLLGILSGAFRDHQINDLDEKDRLYKIIPLMEKIAKNAENIIDGFSTSSSGNVPEEKIISLLNQIAEAESFNLTSSSINLKPVKAGKPILELEIVVTGDGKLPSIIKFLDSVMNKEQLLSEKSFDIKPFSGKPEHYSAQLIFSRMALQKRNAGHE